MNPLPSKSQQYWRQTLRITALLLALWAVVSFGGGYFAGALGFRFFGWPFNFWVAAQGALLVFCLIVWVYAHTMDRLDQACGLAEED